MQRITALALLALLGPTRALAQSFVESEPNDDKATADFALTCVDAGETITGDSTGSAVAGGGAMTRDYYRVRTCAGPPCIVENRLTITTPVVGHTGTVRGLQQIAGVPVGGTDVTLQTSSLVTTPPRYVQWYGFGFSEDIYFSVTGTAATTASYMATLSETGLIPPPVPGGLLPGMITVSSVGLTTTDTEVYVYDASFQPVPTFHNDDEGPAGPTLQSRVTRILAAGIYYVAISNFNTANHAGDANPDEDFLVGNLLDFPDAVANSSAATGLNLNFTLFDGVTLVPVVATKSSAYQVAWFQFTVGTPGAFNAFCAGDGTLTDHTTPCPCNNNGSAGNGCANSANPNGANLNATGTAALDNVVLNGSGMPSTVTCIYLQGDGLADSTFGDGTRCTGGTLIRLRTRMNSAGASSFPDSTDTITLSARGSVVVGSGVRRYYQTYYRNSAAAFCPPETFNVTNAWVIDW